MESRKAALSLLAAVILASACSHTSGGGDEASTAITVESFSVYPRDNMIYEGTSARVSVDVSNTGNLPAHLYLGPDGENVLRDYCPGIFEIREFSVVTSGERRGQAVDLEPGQSVRLRWQLAHTGDVPLYGERCPNVEASMAFNYSVQAYRQLQIKRAREVEGSPQLRWESSAGPMRFAIEAVGGAQQRASSFLATEEGVDRSINILLQLQNLAGEDRGAGVVNVMERSLAVRSTSPLQLDEGFSRFEQDDVDTGTSSPGMEPGEGFSQGGGEFVTGAATAVSGDPGLKWKVHSESYGNPRCDLQTGEDIRMFDGESRVISCSVPLPSRDELSSPSVISTVFAKVNYTYMKEIGSTTIEVRPRGQ